MKKNRILLRHDPGRFKKMWLMLKLTFFCLFLGIFQLHARSQAVTLNLKDATLKQVIWAIENQTNFIFMYSMDDLDQAGKVTVNLKSEQVETILQHCLQGTGLTYVVQDEVIVLRPRMAVQAPEKIGLTGQVKDKQGNVLPGVTIVLKGTTFGVTTNEMGEFKMEVPAQENMYLVFSFIGMKPMEVAIKDNKPLKVVMQDETVNMDEVVVTGYFNFNKGNFTGDATSFSGEELKKVNPVNALTALSILDPSFKMVENIVDGSNPNVIPQFQVRGGASLPNVKNDYDGDPNMPTFIMDGFEVSAEKVFDLDPNRIESMTLLKDAAATAIYGSRAANGVVVITTKMPARGSLSLTYNMDLSFNIPDLRDYDLLNSRDKLQLEKDAGFYSSTVPGLMEERENQYNYKLGLINRGYDTYWLNKPLHVAVGHKHSLYVEGGENSIRYSMDLSYESAPGIMKESGRERIGAGMMLQYQMKNITFRNYMTYDRVKAENSPYGSFSAYARANPYYAYTDDYGNYLYMLEDDKRGAFEKIPNPLYNVQLHMIDETNYSSFVDNFSIDWKITEALRLKGNIGLHHKKNEGVVFRPAKHTDFATYSGENVSRKGSYVSTEGKEFGYDGNIVLSYFKQAGDHVLNGNAALNIQDVSSDEYTVSVEGFPDENLDYISFGAQYHKYQKARGKDKVSRLIGFVGNLNYSFKERYLLDLSVRTDASSKFGTNSRWAPFGSVGVGWNIHNENFFKDQVGWIDRLKIRASLGWVGSQSFDPFQAISKYEYNVTEKYRYGIGANMKGLANKDLKWQKTTQRNIGIDFEILNRRVMVTANVYSNLSKSLLADLTLPPSLGFSSYTENVGERQNTGMDLKVRGTIFRNKDGFLNVAVGMQRNKDKLKKISNGLKAWNEVQDDSVTTAPRIRFIEGQSTNTIWGVPSKGINPANGKEIFVNRYGQRTDVWNARDQQPIGCTDPKLEGNISVSGGYKGFQLSMYMMYSLGGDTYNQTLVDRVENADKRYNCDRRVLEDRWKEAGDVTFFKDIRNGDITQATSRFVEKYNYLKMSSLSLSYDFNTNWLKPLRVQSFRLSFYMNDVFRWSSVKEERGLDYPFARNFRTSLRITF